MKDDAERLAREATNIRHHALWQALRPLQNTLGFMQIGAHPDDETSALLALLGRRDGFRLAYACATRGEGGQNALGSETGADLGAIRTREMEEAARVLDLHLYWLSECPEDQIIDFRFSKSGTETLHRWGHVHLLERLVRAMREERPDIVCPTFLDVPGQHGHHRAITRIAREAFDLAGNPAIFAGHLRMGLTPWSASKFYLPAWSGASASYDDARPPPSPTLVFDPNEIETFSRLSYARLGEHARRFHASQGMGWWQETPALPLPLHLAASTLGPVSSREGRLAEGLPLRLSDWGDGLNARCRKALAGADEHIDAALALPIASHELARALALALGKIRAARAAMNARAGALFEHRLIRKERELSRALFRAAGMQARAELSRDSAAPGASVTARLRIENGTATHHWRLPEGWQAQPDDDGAHEIRIAADAPYETGYAPRFDPGGRSEPIRAVVTTHIAGVKVEIEIAPQRRLAIHPPVSLAPDPAAILINSALPARPIALALELHAEDAAHRTRVTLPALAGLTPPHAVECDIGARETRSTHVTLDGAAAQMPAQAVGDIMLDHRPAYRVVRTAYPHIGPLTRVEPARLHVLRVAAAIAPGTRVAYLGGGHERVCHWLAQLGIDIVSIRPHDAARTDFSAFTTVLIGVSAFGSCPALAAVTARLHQFVEAGGHLVTLYHRPMDHWDPAGTPLAPITIGAPSLRWRITDESAPVTILDPQHALLNTPNVIGDSDWAGWKKERALYLASAWDARYSALLGLADPDETPLKGALLSGQFGRGRHTHVALALPSELDLLTPGAFRLMANFVAPAQAIAA